MSENIARSAKTSSCLPPTGETGGGAEWRPIKDATKKLCEFVDLWVVYQTTVHGRVAYRQEYRCADARWVDWATGRGRWIDSGGNDIEYHVAEQSEKGMTVCERFVSHWMPRPAPPEVKP